MVQISRERPPMPSVALECVCAAAHHLCARGFALPFIDCGVHVLRDVAEPGYHTAGSVPGQGLLEVVDVLAAVFGNDDEVFDADAAELFVVEAGLDGQGVAGDEFGPF